jgi:hypothetical protein
VSYYYECNGSIEFLEPVSAATLRKIEADTVEGIVVLWPGQVLVDPHADDAERQTDDARDHGEEVIDPWDLAPFIMTARKGDPQPHELGEIIPIEARSIQWRTVFATAHPIGDKGKAMGLVAELNRILRIILEDRPDGELPIGDCFRMDMHGERLDDIVSVVPRRQPNSDGNLLDVRVAPQLEEWSLMPEFGAKAVPA